MKSKKGESIVWGTLLGWILAIAVLILIGGILYGFYTGKIYEIINFLKNMIRFGR
ncbi:hypothetical protein J4402_05720 [Candidatus Pacearchaeota archaeon]|nr:hypothetical protein [Candidatus Pacearchaeota archaeon]